MEPVDCNGKLVELLSDASVRRFDGGKPRFYLFPLRERPEIDEPQHRQYADSCKNKRQNCDDRRRRDPPFIPPLGLSRF